MLEEGIRKLSKDYLRSKGAEDLSAENLITFVEKNFSSDFIMTVLFSVFFYHIKKESFFDFVNSNRHELLPDKLSSMVYTEHSVLQYVNKNKDKVSFSNNATFIKIFKFLESIQANLSVDDREFNEDGDLNLEKGLITEKSRENLRANAEEKYKEIANDLCTNNILIEFYVSALGKLPVILYLLGRKAKGKAIDQIRSIANEATQLLSCKKNVKGILRPLIREFSSLAEGADILQQFDTLPYRMKEQDIYVATIYCIFIENKSQHTFRTKPQ
mgnify:CR=1 FL=1|tara:strand:+ start:49 stop:864 length:816 start_codon:yes stop_codon:yes gene_type:complete